MARSRRDAAGRPRKRRDPAGRKPPKPRAKAPRDPGAMRIARLEQVKVMAHPLRLRMLELFGQEPRTAKQIAQILGEKPTRLYHHVDAMARVGLIELVETRQVRGATEKYYRAAARRFEVGHDLYAAEGAAGAEVETRGMIRTVVEAARDEALDYFMREHRDPAVPPVVARAVIRGTKAEIDAVRRALMKVLEMHRPKDDRRATAGSVRYALSLLFHPVPEE